MAVVGVTVTVACGSGAGRSGVRVAPAPNSEAGKTGPQVLADAMRALATVPAVHVTGTLTDTTTKQVAKFDARIQADGGTESIQSPTGTMQLIYVKGRPYFKGVASFFVPSVAKKLAGHWVSVDFGSDVGGEPMSPTGMAQELGAPGGAVRVEPKVAAATLGGQRVLVVRESDGGLMEVAAKGAPLPLRVVGKSSDSSGLAGLGDLTFDYSDDPVQLSVPLGAITVPVPSFALPTDFPSAFPTSFPSGFPSAFVSEFASAFPSGFPTAFTSDGIPTPWPSALGSAPDPAFSSSSSSSFDPLPRGLVDVTPDTTPTP
jgi:hypothetical protein